MAKQKKPTVTVRCVAESHNARNWSRIIEFSGEVGGGLIDVQDWTIDGRAFVRVDLNRLDEDVRVRVEAKHLELSPNQWRAAEARASEQPNTRLNTIMQMAEDYDKAVETLSLNELDAHASRLMRGVWAALSDLRPAKENEVAA